MLTIVVVWVRALCSLQKRARVGVGLAFALVQIALVVAEFGESVVLAAVQFDRFTVVLWVLVVAVRLEVLLLLILVAQHRAQMVHLGAELLGEQRAKLLRFLLQSVHHFDWLLVIRTVR